MKKGMAHFDFELLKIWIVPRAKYFAFWFFTLSLREGSRDWELFAVKFNNIAHVPFRFMRCRLIITIFNHDIRFGEISESRMNELCGVKQ